MSVDEQVINSLLAAIRKAKGKMFGSMAINCEQTFDTAQEKGVVDPEDKFINIKHVSDIINSIVRHQEQQTKDFIDFLVNYHTQLAYTYGIITAMECTIQSLELILAGKDFGNLIDFILKKLKEDTNGRKNA